MPIAVIAFDFDPLLRLTDGLVVRWQTVALAAVISAVLIVTGVLARRATLRAEDLLYIAVGVVPGAVIGGRIGFAVTHWEVVSATPAALIDPAVGGLDLAAGVIGGTLTGAYVASLLGAPVGAWARVVALPLLVAIGAGKLTMVLGGSGQGLPSDAAWATAYLGPGPWGSLAPALPSHPAQAYEGLATLGWVAVLGLGVALAGRGDAGDGRRLLVAIAGWSIIRAAASLAWRDPAVVGPFGPGGIVAILVAAGCVVGIAVLSLARRRPRHAEPGDAEPSWPDPATRPEF